MKSYFETTVKYETTAENGKLVKVSEKYLIDALSFTEAEAKTCEHVKPFISGEFTVSAIKRAKVNEIFYNETVLGDKWFRAKVNFITLDEEKAIEKKTAVNMMIQAEDLKQARETLEQRMKGSIADYEVEAVAETKILEVIEYRD